MYKMMRKWRVYGRIHIDLWDSKTEHGIEFSVPHTKENEKRLAEIPFDTDLDIATVCYIMQLNVLTGGFDNE